MHTEEGKAYARAWRATHPLSEDDRQTRAQRFKEWATTHDRSEYQRRYREQNREAIQTRARERYKKDPHVRARRLIQQRVQKGRMPRASDLKCKDCGNQAEEYDHYLGYEKPFDSMVEAVCRPCHLRRETAKF